MRRRGERKTRRLGGYHAARGWRDEGGEERRGENEGEEKGEEEEGVIKEL